eukprot:c20117_g1_i1 orf=76-429(+)
MALFLHQLSWGRHVSSWAPSPPGLDIQGPGRGSLAPLRIEAGAGKKRVPRTESHKVLNLRSQKKDAAKKLGETIAMECLKQGFSRVIYYRRGTLHWKRVKTFRLAAEEFGLEFEYPD